MLQKVPNLIDVLIRNKFISWYLVFLVVQSKLQALAGSDAAGGNWLDRYDLRNCFITNKLFTPLHSLNVHYDLQRQILNMG